MDKTVRRIKFKPTNVPSKGYLFNLLCSSLNGVVKTRSSELISLFEATFCEAFDATLPNNAEVHTYGTLRRIPPGNFKCTSNNHDRRFQSVSELRGVILLHKRDFHPNGSGDNVLDPVTWIQMGENNDVLPYYYRTAGHDWYTTVDLPTLVIDRLGALRHESNPLSDPQIIALVDEATKFKREVVSFVTHRDDEPPLVHLLTATVLLRTSVLQGSFLTACCPNRTIRIGYQPLLPSFLVSSSVLVVGHRLIDTFTSLSRHQQPLVTFDVSG